MFKYAVQVFAPSGNVGSFPLEASSDKQATSLASAQAKMPDEDGTARIVVLRERTGRVVSSVEVKVVATSMARAGATALAAKRLAEAPELQALLAQRVADARARALAAGLPVLSDVPDVKSSS